MEKPDQVRWLEGVLGYRLFPGTADVLMTKHGRNCYLADDDGNITGLNLSACWVRDVSFLKELGGLASLDLSHNQLKDGSFLKGLTEIQFTHHHPRLSLRATRRWYRGLPTPRSSH